MNPPEKIPHELAIVIHASAGDEEGLLAQLMAGLPASQCDGWGRGALTLACMATAAAPVS